MYEITGQHPAPHETTQVWSVETFSQSWESPSPIGKLYMPWPLWLGTGCMTVGRAICGPSCGYSTNIHGHFLGPMMLPHTSHTSHTWIIRTLMSLQRYPSCRLAQRSLEFPHAARNHRLAGTNWLCLCSHCKSIQRHNAWKLFRIILSCKGKGVLMGREWEGVLMSLDRGIQNHSNFGMVFKTQES
jgi:hypothetical protein